MIIRGRSIGHRLAAGAAAGLVLAAVAGCTTQSPAAQADRERKAAGVVLFKLHMNSDLWSRTNQERATFHTLKIDKPKNITERPDGMVTVELTGAQMVDYLQILNHNAHGGEGAVDKSLAAAVYDAVVPVIDSIENPRPANAPTPEITIHAGPASTPTPSSPATPTPPR